MASLIWGHHGVSSCLRAKCQGPPFPPFAYSFCEDLRDYLGVAHLVFSTRLSHPAHLLVSLPLGTSSHTRCSWTDGKTTCSR